jgi:hypothetical protein
MNDGGEKRQAPPLDSQSDAFHFGRTGSNAYVGGQNGSRSRQSGAISPPPLKRQRLSTDFFESHASSRGSVALRHRYAYY